MSKCYKAEDVIIAIEQMQDGYNGWSDTYDKAQIIGVLEELPTIEVSNDCISRGWVQNRLTKYVKDYELNELDSWQNTIVEWIATDIEDAPSVVPSRAEGEWIADTPQTDYNANQCVQRIEYVGDIEKKRCQTCNHFTNEFHTPIASDGTYYTYVICTAKECHYEAVDTPQTDLLVKTPRKSRESHEFAEELETERTRTIREKFLEVENEQTERSE